MTNELVLFDFDGHDVRIHLDDEGNPWFVAADVCRVLEVSNVSDAVSRLDSDECDDIGFADTIGRIQKIKCVNESGFYTLTIRSNKPQAKPFRRKVTHDILPQIRKTGRYEPELPAITDPTLQMLMEQSRQMQLMIVRLDRQQAETAEAKAQAAKAERLALQIAGSQQYMTIREFVKFHELMHQMPPGKIQQAYGRYLVGYCKETGWPLRKVPTENMFSEWAYPTHVIQQTIHGFLGRHYGQMEISDDGIWTRD